MTTWPDWGALSWSSLAFAFAVVVSPAHAITVTPKNHASERTVDGVRHIYFPTMPAGSCVPSSGAGTYRTYPSSLVPLDPGVDNTALEFDLTPTKSLTTINGGTAPSNGDEILIAIEYAGNSNHTKLVLKSSELTYSDSSVRTLLKYGTTVDGTTRQIGLHLKNITGNSVNSFCSLINILDSSFSCQPAIGVAPIPIALSFGFVDADDPSFTKSSNDISTETIKVVLVDCPPGASGSSIASPTVNFATVPGDESAKIVNAAAAPVDSVGIRTMVAYFDTATIPTLSASVQKELGGTGPGVYQIGGLSNDTQYCIGLGYVNYAGFVSTSASWTTSFQTETNNAHCVTPSKIDGFLSKNSCLAGFLGGDEGDPNPGGPKGLALRGLRAFRSLVLMKFATGRTFVHWYYHSLSPAAVKWLRQHPTLVETETRRQALFFLGLLALMVVFTLMVRGLGRTLRTVWKWRIALAVPVGAMVILWLSTSAMGAEPDAQRVQPYLEKLKDKYHILTPSSPEPEPRSAPIGADSSTDSLKSSGPDQPVQPYIDALKEKADRDHTATAESSPGKLPPIPYTEALKIGAVPKVERRKTVQNAAGFSIVVGNKFDIRSKASQANSFESVYGTADKYNPGVNIFYERQLLRSPTLGSLGPYARLGFVTTKGKGVFTNRASAISDVDFRFVAFPSSFGASYRFTQLKLLVPFAQLGAMMVPFMETRGDDHPDRRGLSRGIDAVIGFGINLDWISRKSAWDQYDAQGVLHTYLVAQMEFVRSIASAITFNYDGKYLGLAFEF